MDEYNMDEYNMGEYIMEEFNIEEYNMESNCRNQFYLEEGFLRKINMKKIGGYLRKLKENGDDYKIKHIKKLYQIYNILYQIKSLIYSKDTFEYTDKSLSTDDFYNFLCHIIGCIKYDIIKFIDMLQDDNFDNDEPLLINLDENKKKFSTYLNFKHFC